jgi:hypothetical protein
VTPHRVSDLWRHCAEAIYEIDLRKLEVDALYKRKHLVGYGSYKVAASGFCMRAESSNYNAFQ